MVFSSPIFLFYFLPCLIGLYFLTPRAAKNVLLLFASLLFYAWGEDFYVLLMLVSIGINYVFGMLIARGITAERARSALVGLSVGVALNLSILIAFKYANFLVDNINVLLELLSLPSWDLGDIHLPLGISFFTFQAISYLIDIYRKEIAAQKNLIRLGLYISLFPQLIAGPIVRYKNIAQEIGSRTVSASLFLSGAERFSLGLAKKMLIANPLGAVVDIIFSAPIESIPTHIAWLGILLYALQIFFDFSGYSDMAIGLGRMFGFRFLENFNYPYIARSLQDFWRRWHISLSSWFRDYLYIPLGGNRISPFRTYLNLCMVFLLCGIWHGASWNFLVWGAFHGLVLVIERLGLARLLTVLWRPVQHIYLILIVLVSWVFFRAENLGDAVAYLGRMFANEFTAIPFEIIDAINIEVLFALTAGLIFSMNLTGVRQSLVDGFQRFSSFTRIGYGLFVCLCLLLAIMQLAVTTHNPFIYFRF